MFVIAFLILGILVIGLFGWLIYLILKWILKELNISSDRGRKIIPRISAILFTPITLGVLLLFLFKSYDSTSYFFTEHRWKNEPSERYTMSKDLIESRILLGSTKEKVIEKLGDNYYRYDESTIYYDLKTPMWLVKKNPEILEIRFWNNRVVEVVQPGVKGMKNEE